MEYNCSKYTHARRVTSGKEGDREYLPKYFRISGFSDSGLTHSLDLIEIYTHVMWVDEHVNSPSRQSIIWLLLQLMSLIIHSVQ